MPNKLPLFLISVLFISAAFSQQKKKPVQARPVSQPYPFPVIKDDPSPVKIITFKKDTAVYIPKWFYIKNVVVDSSAADSIGFILQPRSAKKQKLMLDKGTKAYVENWLAQQVVSDTALYPLTLRIQKIDIAEKKLSEFRRDGKINLKFISEYTGKGKTLNPGGYDGYYEYSYTPGMPHHIDSAVTDALNYTLRNIDNIMEDAVSSSLAFCKKVKLNFNYRTDNDPAGDTVFYSGIVRPTWDDFTGIASGVDNYYRQYVSMYFDYEPGYSKGVLTLDIKTGAYFVKSLSWAGKKAQRPELINHLNYRFKMIWLQAVRVKKKLEKMELNCDNYRKEINDIVEASLKQLTAALEQFDKETLNGTNKKEQLRWEEFLDKQYNEYELIK